MSGYPHSTFGIPLERVRIETALIAAFAEPLPRRSTALQEVLVDFKWSENPELACWGLAQTVSAMSQCGDFNSEVEFARRAKSWCEVCASDYCSHCPLSAARAL